MQTSTVTTSQYLKVLTILCYAHIAGLVIFGSVAGVLTVNHVFTTGPRSGFSSNSPARLIFYVALIIISAGCISAANIFFKKRITTVKQSNVFGEKMNGYRAAIIQRNALLEAPGLFSLIIFLLTEETRVLIITLITITLMLYLRPSKERLINDLELSNDEVMIINDPDGIVG